MINMPILTMLAAVVVLSGCSPAVEFKAQCEAPADCNADQLCSDGVCVSRSGAADMTVDVDLGTAMDGGSADMAGSNMDGPDMDGPDMDGPDIGGPDVGTATGDGCEAIRILQANCANGGCHLPHNNRTSLVLTVAAVRQGSLNGYVVPGDPDSSYLFQRMTGDEHGPRMPLGTASPIAELGAIEAWITRGAPTLCGDELPVPHLDPNHQDREALFRCDDSPSLGTPSRLRRVGQREWTRAVLKPLNGTWWGSTAKDNPLAAPDRLAYSTYPADLSVDGSMLDLYLLFLAEAPVNWTANDARSGGLYAAGVRTASVYNNLRIRCMFRDNEPDEDCIQEYVRVMLTEGVLFRQPTAGEQARLSTLLREALTPNLDERRATLHFVGESAFLMAGALFRSEVGLPVDGEPGRYRLSADEMALALGHVLSAHPTGAAVPISVSSLPPEDPDSASPELGRLGLIRAAADDGTIFDPNTLVELMETYQGGVDINRHDLLPEIDDQSRPRRGEYWIAENIMQFFREWLAYDDVNRRFKDTPGATSPWDGEFNGDPMNDPTTLGFRNLQTARYGHESTLRDQLDDTIARTVLDSQASNTNVFAALMTTRLWRLPSNLANTNGVACNANDDCTIEGFTRCSQIGICGTSITKSTTSSARVYGLGRNVEATPEGRWVTMAEGTRSGVLTHPAWLAAHGGNFEDDASAVRRGRWIRERLFCETVPSLDLVQVEAKLVPSAAGLSARARLHQSVEDPATNPQSATCMGCHALMNDLGHPFEIYNHAGFPREFDHGPEGPIAPSGRTQIALPPDPTMSDPIEDAIEFAQLAAQSVNARRCFIRQVFRYFTGRDERLSDSCVLSEMESALNNNESFFAMLQILVMSRAFQDRIPPQEVP